MKKILLLILILAVAFAGLYIYRVVKNSNPVNVNSFANPNPPSPSPVSPPHEEGMGEVTTPPPAPSPAPNPNPAPVKDDPEDVDVAPAKVFKLTGKNFSFSQSEIRVKKGDRVVINFESTDGFHDWVVDEFNAATSRVNPGTKTSVEFIAGQTGTFEYYCSVSIHRAAGMKGQLIVE